MIDTFGLALSHGLIAIAVWRLMQRPDLNDDAAVPPPAGTSIWNRWKSRGDA
jgi:hypothetical protein